MLLCSAQTIAAIIMLTMVLTAGYFVRSIPVSSSVQHHLQASSCKYWDLSLELQTSTSGPPYLPGRLSLLTGARAGLDQLDQVLELRVLWAR